MPEQMVKMIAQFQVWLPDIDILFNENDEPRLVIPWEVKQDLLRKSEQTKLSQPAEYTNWYPAQSWRLSPSRLVNHSTLDKHRRNRFYRIISLTSLEIHNRRMSTNIPRLHSPSLRFPSSRRLPRKTHHILPPPLHKIRLLIPLRRKHLQPTRPPLSNRLPNGPSLFQRNTPSHPHILTITSRTIQ